MVGLIHQDSDSPRISYVRIDVLFCEYGWQLLPSIPIQVA